MSICYGLKIVFLHLEVYNSSCSFLVGHFTYCQFGHQEHTLDYGHFVIKIFLTC